MPNNRIFYACQAVALATEGTNNTWTVLHGVQSVGVNTTFNLEQAFELGQISIYENIENLPDVEVTIERVLDGYPLAYRLATRGATDSTLVNRTKKRCNAVLAIYPDDQVVITGNAPVQVYMSGMYINSVSYTLPTDGNCTESITLVGNNKVWEENAGSRFTTNVASGINKGSTNGVYDTPYNSQAGTLAAGIQRRENVLMASSILPKSIFGVGNTATSGNNWNVNTPKAHIQSISMSTDLGREDILELGRKTPYYRAPNFPVEVTSEFEVIAISGDFVSAYEAGNPDLAATAAAGDNTTEETIKIMLQDGTTFDLGSKNRLSSVTFGGGDAGGGNATMTYSYSTFNDFTINGPWTNAGEA
jgi:hypothetical protein